MALTVTVPVDVGGSPEREKGKEKREYGWRVDETQDQTKVGKVTIARPTMNRNSSSTSRNSRVSAMALAAAARHCWLIPAPHSVTNSVDHSERLSPCPGVYTPPAVRLRCRTFCRAWKKEKGESDVRPAIPAVTVTEQASLLTQS